MSRRLRSLLHRPLHLVTPAGTAKRQTGRHALSPSHPQPPLRPLRPARTPRSLQPLEAIRGDVRPQRSTGLQAVGVVGEEDAAYIPESAGIGPVEEDTLACNSIGIILPFGTGFSRRYRRKSRMSS